MRINKINFIKNFASFKNFEWNSDKTNDFERINLVYGYNGMGKTMLSRFFSYLSSGDTKTPELDLSQVSFSCETDKGRITNFDNPITKNHIFVFNSDFVRKELFFEENKANKITYYEISAQNILLNSKLKTTAARQAFCKSKSDYYNQEKNKQKKQLDSIISTYQENIIAKLDIQKSQFRTDIAKKCLESVLSVDYKLKQEDIDKATIEYRQEAKKHLSFLFQKERFFLSKENLEKIAALCLEKIKRQTASDLKDAVLDWISRGMEFQELNTTKCLFCNQPLTKSYWEKRKQEILDITQKDESFASKEKELKNWYENINQLSQRTFNLNERNEDFYINFQSQFQEANQKMATLYSQSLTDLKLLNSFLDIKIQDMGIQLDITVKKCYQNLQNISTQVDGVINALQQIYEQNNAYTQDIQMTKKTAETNIKKYYAGLAVESYKKTQKKMDFYDKKLTKANSILDKISNIITKIEKEKANQTAPIEEITHFLKIITGKPDYLKLAYDSKEQMYLLKRLENGTYKSATLLSDGEKNMLAFSYFLAKIKEKTNSNIIVIDDPISSLDNTHFFNILQLLLDQFGENKKVNQVFILTHNFFFFKKLRRHLKGLPVYDPPNQQQNKKLDKNTNKKSLEDKQIYLVYRDATSSKILPPTPFLLKFNNEYCTLVESLCQFEKNNSADSFSYEQALLIVNAMRRILEFIFSFKYLGSNTTENFKKSLKGTHPEWNYLITILHTESHSDKPNTSLEYSTFAGMERLINDFKGYIHFIDPEHFQTFYGN